MKVKDLIKKLMLVDPELDVILETEIDCMDSEITPYPAYNVYMGEISPITFRYANAQSNRETESDSFDEDWVRFGYDGWKDPIDSKKVLVISSPEFKYGTREKEESDEFKVKG